MKAPLLLPGDLLMNRITGNVLIAGHEISPDTIELMFRTASFTGLFSAYLERHFQRYGLSQPGFMLLLLLHTQSEETWTAARLADTLGVRAPTMTGILDTLQKQGFMSDSPRSTIGEKTASCSHRREEKAEAHSARSFSPYSVRLRTPCHSGIQGKLSGRLFAARSGGDRACRE